MFNSFIFSRFAFLKNRLIKYFSKSWIIEFYYSLKYNNLYNFIVYKGNTSKTNKKNNNLFILIIFTIIYS